MIPLLITNLILNFISNGPSCSIISTKDAQTLTCNYSSQALNNLSDLDLEKDTTIHIRFQEDTQNALNALKLVCVDQKRCELFLDGKAVKQSSGLNKKVYLSSVFK